MKCWMEFGFDQTLRPTIVLEETLLQCFAALPTKLCPESSHVRAASHYYESLFYFQAKASSIICNKDGGQGSTARNLDQRI